MVEVADYPAARERLAAEWRAINPQTPAAIAEFYKHSTAIRGDLDEWHAMPARQLVTDMLVHVAKMSNAHTVIDIGCGAGHDLRALRDAGVPVLYGVEPNDALRADVEQFARCSSNVYDAPLDQSDMLVCIDVLEHLPHPELLLEHVATTAPVGTLLFESTATEDQGTPLHLKSNRAWHPGRTLERHGWWVVDRADRIRVWKRQARAGAQMSSILACIYRSMSPVTHGAIMDLVQSNPTWRERVKPGDALIARSRSIITTRWWAETNDDVFLMVDDDVTFSRDDAERLVSLARGGLDLVCGAYPVHNGEHFAIKTLPGKEREPILFGDGDPIEIRYAATGFMAVRREVIDALVPTLPLCEPWSFYPLFQALVVQDEITGDHTLLSEDWGFCEMARRLGFRIWLDPKAILDHESLLPVSVRNMDLIRQAVKRSRREAEEEHTNGRVESDSC